MKRSTDLCKVPSCDKKPHSHNLCSSHVAKMRRYGDPLGGRQPSPGICTIDGCNKVFRAKSMCIDHYRRWSLYGDPLEDRYNRKAQDHYENDVLTYEADECLTWLFARSRDGYGYVSRNGRKRIVSRVLCEDVYGPPPTPKHEAAHNCGNGHLGCVNKRHLRWATRAENRKDMVDHGRSVRGERHHSTKLKVDQVIEIRRQRGKTTTVALAAKYGVSQAAISAIYIGKSWSWMEAS